MKTAAHNLPVFETERFIVAPLSPAEARLLIEVLLQDDRLAARVPWLTEKTQDGALREAYGLELLAATGQVKVWGIVAHDERTQIGAIIARNSIMRVDVEILVASRFWGHDVVDEASIPVTDWLEDNLEFIQNFSISLH